MLNNACQATLAAAEKKAEDKTNAKAKLKAAEYTPLTQDEADAIVI